MSGDSLEIEDLMVSREDAAETLRAIRSGRVDALVVNRPNGHEVVTFHDPEHAYRALLEAMGESAALVTADGVICYHNPRLSALTVGSGAASLRGRALRALVARDAASSVDSMLERAQRGPARIEADLVAADGSHLAVQMTATAGSLGEVPVLCVVITDLSGQRLQEELYRQVLVGMEARERLLSIAGHELRAPLQGILFELDAVDRSAGTAASAQLESIRRRAQHLASLVDSLLDVGLVRSDQLVLSLEEVDLAEVVRAVAARSERLSGASPVALELRAVAGRWDRLRLEQVVTNLVSNAGKYGLGRPIRIVVDGDDEVARLVVEDHGIGIPPDAIGQLFQPFSRVGSVKSSAGLGLGLYITAHIVKAHRGVIRVESEPEVGTRFVVELPRA